MRRAVVRVEAEPDDEQDRNEHERLELQPLSHRSELRALVARKVDAPWQQPDLVRCDEDRIAAARRDGDERVARAERESRQRVDHGQEADRDGRRGTERDPEGVAVARNDDHRRELGTDRRRRGRESVIEVGAQDSRRFDAWPGGARSKDRICDADGDGAVARSRNRERDGSRGDGACRGVALRGADRSSTDRFDHPSGGVDDPDAGIVAATPQRFHLEAQEPRGHLGRDGGRVARRNADGLGERARVVVALGHPGVDHVCGASRPSDESTSGGGVRARSEIGRVHGDGDHQRDADPAGADHRDGATALSVVT